MLFRNLTPERHRAARGLALGFAAALFFAASGHGPAAAQEPSTVDPDSLSFELVDGLEVADQLTYRRTPTGEDGDMNQLRGEMFRVFLRHSENLCGLPPGAGCTCILDGFQASCDLVAMCLSIGACEIVAD